MPSGTDEELVGLLSEGDLDALEELYRRYASRLYVFCRRAMGCAQAEDVVHDTFIRVIEASDQFDARRAPFRAWVFGVARNRCIDLHRKDRRQGSVSVGEGAAVAAHGDADPLSDVIDDKVDDAAVGLASVTEAVRSCIRELQSEEQRQVLVLYYAGQLVFREIAEVLGRSTSMAQKLLGQARENVRRCLERKGVERASLTRS